MKQNIKNTQAGGKGEVSWLPAAAALPPAS